MSRPRWPHAGRLPVRSPSVMELVKYWARFAGFVATIAIGFAVTAVVTTIALALTGAPTDVANVLAGVLSSLAGITVALRVFTVPTVAVVWATPVAPLRELTADDVAARLDRAA